MTGKRKRYSAEFKAKVALEAIRGELTVSQLVAKHGVHQTLINAWKKQAMEGMAGVFSGKAEAAETSHQGEVEKLHAMIGQLVVERGFFAQGLRSMSIGRRRELVEADHPRLSITRQCELVSISRSSYYGPAKGEPAENLELMRLIDGQFLETPWYGSRQMTRHLRRHGHQVNRKRVRRLMVRMGLQAVYQRPKTTVPHPEHKVWPYLLRDLTIDRPNQVWCSDITYIPMRRGFLYLVAVMDWATRKVLSWRLSNTMDFAFCIEAVEEAMARYGRPDIFNTDQGSQFTSPRFTGLLTAAGIRVSMDGRGRWMDNVFIERLWRSMKYECVYLHAFETGSEARAGIGHWIDYYNHERPHSALGGRTPAEAYEGTRDQIRLAA
ncbi:IS3 family transposase (plasmid) [Azospirillum humicireducens]|uniref:IS3 family transposase n=1 Tax=Azospirillum humicireducens TaxID=1226968 RepID=A0A2R4VUF4_9PROT|nr:IS3 family transposase [Azospirillum humicireducens]AWB08076.1 IS3 family transposase [Azospirillum humicireducens]